jgi:hypothetical protein
VSCLDELGNSAGDTARGPLLLGEVAQHDGEGDLISEGEDSESDGDPESGAETKDGGQGLE